MITILDYQVKFDDQRRVLLLVFHNDLTESSLLAGFAAATAVKDAFAPVESGITDLSEVHSVLLSPDFIRNFVKFCGAIMPGKPRVIVAPLHAYGTVRLFQIHREMVGDTMSVVETMAEALTILGLESPEFRLVSEPEEPGQASSSSST